MQKVIIDKFLENAIVSQLRTVKNLTTALYNETTKSDFFFYETKNKKGTKKNDHMLLKITHKLIMLISWILLIQTYTIKKLNLWLKINYKVSWINWEDLNML